MYLNELQTRLNEVNKQSSMYAVQMSRVPEKMENLGSKMCQKKEKSSHQMCQNSDNGKGTTIDLGTFGGENPRMIVESKI